MYQLLPFVLEGNEVRRPEHFEAPQFYSVYAQTTDPNDPPGIFLWKMDFLQRDDANRYIAQEVVQSYQPNEKLYQQTPFLESEIFFLKQYDPWLERIDGGMLCFDIPRQFSEIEEALIKRLELDHRQPDGELNQNHGRMTRLEMLAPQLDLLESRVRARYPAHILEEISVKPR